MAIGIADGYAQATGRTTLVNLHSAAGPGNSMGGFANAWNAHSPLVVTAGQQIRAMMGIEPLLTNLDATTLPKPLVKWSYEPARAEDVPLAIVRFALVRPARARAGLPFSSPMTTGPNPPNQKSLRLLEHAVFAAGTLDASATAELASRLDRSTNPVIVLGPDVDAARANQHAVRLAERLKAPVWIAPSAPRCPFSTTHSSFRGLLPASMADISRLLEGHDLVLVAGAPVFRYHQYDPGPLLPPGAELIQITCDPDEAARAPMGDAVVGDVGRILAALADAVGDAARAAPQPREAPPRAAAGRRSPPHRRARPGPHGRAGSARCHLCRRIHLHYRGHVGADALEEAGTASGRRVASASPCRRPWASSSPSRIGR